MPIILRCVLVETLPSAVVAALLADVFVDRNLASGDRAAFARELTWWVGGLGFIGGYLIAQMNVDAREKGIACDMLSGVWGSIRPADRH